MDTKADDIQDQHTIKHRLKHFLKSKLLVLTTLVMLIIGLADGVSQSQADSSNYDLSMVYQYFLLDNRNGFKPTKEHDLKGWVNGFLGW